MMRFLSLCLICLSTVSLSQVPDYFGNSPSWKLSGVWSGGIDCPLLFYERGYVVTDTFQSNGYLYYRLTKYTTEKYTDFNYDYCGYPIQYSVHPNFIDLRQDGRKIYMDNSSNSLFVTYELNVGDTLSDCYVASGLNEDFIVSSVDSILVGSSYRRVIDFDTPNDSNVLHFVEGISHEYKSIFFPISQYFEPFPSIYSFEDIWGMECYSENGVSLWPNVSSGDCVVPFAVGIEESDDVSTLIYPNPVLDHLTLQTNQIIQTIEIFNMNGKLILQTSNPNVDVSELSNGLYVLKAFFRDGSTSLERFIKN